MSRWGSGREQSGKDTTSDMRALDVRRLQRDGLLTPVRWLMWTWPRNGEEVTSIQIRTETDRVMLNYKNRRNGGGWQFSFAAPSSPVGTATSWPARAKGKRTMIGRRAAPTPYRAGETGISAS